MSPAQHILQCVRRTVRSKDGRGPWQSERSCAAALARTGSPSIAANTAAAARRLGEWIRSQG